jgi:hypothetical protein
MAAMTESHPVATPPAPIRSAVLKQAVEFYKAKALDVLSGERGEKVRFVFESGRRRDSNMQPSNINGNNLVAPTGFEPVNESGHVFANALNELRQRNDPASFTRPKHA